ncbi:MAG: hypothetical protein IT379_01930 [Deltaproteobacteria bacterium]|nr:hypothetical protein [Deltaproteobacteria bacterium]
MPRSRLASSRPPASPPAADDAPRLGLVFEAGRGKLRVESPVTLASPAASRPIVLRSLDLDIGPVRFPLDVSGGAGRFRTRRMALARAELALPLPAIEALVSQRVRWLGRGSGVRVRLARGPAEDGVSLVVTLVPRSPSVSPVVFGVALIADGLDLIALVHDARSASDGPAAPTSLALDALASIGARWDGTSMRFSRVDRRVLEEVLVARGFRLPDVRDVRLSAPRIVDDDVLLLGWSPQVGADAAPLAHARLLDAHRRLGACDGALAKGDRLAARAALSTALAALPRSPPLLLRLAELDADEPGLEPSVRSVLLELSTAAEGASPAVVDTLGLRLALRIGDLDDVYARAERLAADLDAPELAAAALTLAGEALLATRPELGAALLWRASSLRRTDVHLHARLLAVADRAGLDLATIEELGARWLGAADDADERARAALATGRAAAAVGALPEARAWFERVLRYRPRSHAALVGLGRTLFALADAGRALRVLGRAIELADAASDRSLAADAFAALADIHLSLGDPTAALDAATAAAERTPHDPTVWSRVADLRDATGDPRGAAVAASRSLDEMRRARDPRDDPAAARDAAPATASAGPDPEPPREAPTTELHGLRRRLDRGDAGVSPAALEAVVAHALHDPAAVTSHEALDDLAAVAGMAGRRDAARVAGALARLLATGSAPSLGDPISLTAERRRALLRVHSGGGPIVELLERLAEPLASRCLPPRDWVREAARDHALVHHAREIAGRIAVRPRRLLISSGSGVRAVWLPDGVALVVGRALPGRPARLAYLLTCELLALEHGGVGVPFDVLLDVVRTTSPEANHRPEDLGNAYDELREACRRVALTVTRDPASAVSALVALEGAELEKAPDVRSREASLARSADACRLASWALDGKLLTP